MTLNIHLPDVNLQIDPQRMEDAFSMMIAMQLHRGLFRYNQNGDVLTDLAESWVESSDQLNYTIKLKELNFSNGKKITATHVQMSLARLFYLGSSMAADIDVISGAAEFKKSWDLKKFGVKVKNPSEVQIVLSHPSALFLKQLAVVDCAILDIEDFKLNPNLSIEGGFSGPYKLKKVEISKYTLEKWRKDDIDSERPPQVISFFTTKENPVDLAMAERTDSLDTDKVDAQSTAALKKKGWSSSPTELTYESFVILNPKFVPFEVRRELYYKISQKDLVKALGNEKLIPAFGLIPNGFYGAILEKPVLEQNVNPYAGKKVSFVLDYLAGSDFDKKLAEYLKEKWTTDKIEVVLKEFSRGEKLTRMFSKTAEATVSRKGTDYPDGYSVLTYFKGKYESNYFHCDDPKIDAMIASSAKEFSQEKRARKYQDIQKLILAHYTNIPLYFGTPASGLWSDKVEMIPAHPLGFHTMPFETILMRSN
tara:strand:- start:63700 stop:65136 length:1437 start_codon:yes stop_codon:yes gene_type:complete